MTPATRKIVADQPYCDGASRTVDERREHPARIARGIERIHLAYPGTDDHDVAKFVDSAQIFPVIFCRVCRRPRLPYVYWKADRA